MTIKRCTQCKNEKLLKEFHKDSRRNDGRQSICKICIRKMQQSSYMKAYGEKARNRNAIRNAEMRARVQTYKSEQGCLKCSETQYQCLDFHHLDPMQKEFGMSNIGTRSWNLIMKEIEKCIVVCKNCHCKIHAGLL